MANFDSIWDRNFQYLTEEELNIDYEFKDELKIQWSAKEYMNPQVCEYLIIATNHAYNLFHCIFLPGIKSDVVTTPKLDEKELESESKSKSNPENFIFNSKPIGKITIISKSKPKLISTTTREEEQQEEGGEE